MAILAMFEGQPRYITFMTSSKSPTLNYTKLDGVAFVFFDQAARRANVAPISSFQVSVDISAVSFKGKLFTFLYTILKQQFQDAKDVINS